MKKIICAAIVAVFAFCFAAIAGNPSCEVRGSSGVIASIYNTRVVGYDNGYVNVNVTLTQPAEAQTYVVVEVYDGNTCIGTVQVPVIKDYRTGSTEFYSSQLVEGNVYTLSLSNAYGR